MADITFNGHIQFMSNSFRDGACHYIFATFKRPNGTFYTNSNGWIVGWRVTLQGGYGPTSSPQISFDDANPFIVPINFTATVPDCVFASCDNRIVFYVIPCCRVDVGFNSNVTLGPPTNIHNLTINQITSSLTNVPFLSWDGFAIYELPLNDQQYYYCNQEVFGLNSFTNIDALINSLSGTNYTRCNTKPGTLVTAPTMLPTSATSSLSSTLRLSFCTGGSLVNPLNSSLVLSTDYSKTDCCFRCSRYQYQQTVNDGDIIRYLYQACGPTNYGTIIYADNNYTSGSNVNLDFCAIENSVLVLYYNGTSWSVLSPTSTNACSTTFYDPCP